jgi:hypothetical protein
VCDWSVSVGWRFCGSSRISRRMAFALLRIAVTSWRTELGQRWRGKVLLADGGAALWGNMADAVSIASPSISWRVFASSSMCVLVSCEVSRTPYGEISPDGNSSESLIERAVAFANMMAVKESIVTLDFQVSKVCSGIGYWNMGTLGG